MEKEMEGNGHGIFQSTVPSFFGLRKNHEKTHSGQSVTQQKFESVTPRI
jgi:hypothetical protein